MIEVEILNASASMSGPYRVDPRRGQNIGRVSSEWFSRPDDERYLSLSELMSSVRKGTEAAARIAHLKKGDMAAEAERLLADTGWIPEPLRTLELQVAAADTPADAEAASDTDDEVTARNASPDQGGEESAAPESSSAIGSGADPAHSEDAAEAPLLAAE